MDSMLEPSAGVISDKLKMLVSTPLPCTDEKPPIALIDDKSRIKKEDRHGIMVRVPVLKKNVFFKTFLVSQPVQEKGDKISMSNVLLNSVCDHLKLQKDEMRQQLVCHAADGAIAHNLHIHTAHAEYLHLDQEYVKELVLWDLAHKIELAAKHAKDKTPWLQKFDSELDHLIIEMKVGSTRSKLMDICSKRNIEFREFDHFSLTRFMQYSYRIYNSVAHMWLPMSFLK